MGSSSGLKPFSEASERNREPVLEKLRVIFERPGDVLEIGSGTGQHAVYFGANLTHLRWNCSDRAINHAGIKMWLEESALDNVLGPLELDVSANHWPRKHFAYAFSANTTHIMSWAEVGLMFTGIGKILESSGIFVLYGPFNYDGKFTSDSNRRFDASLRSGDSNMGLRDMRDIRRLAAGNGLMISADHEMPANNRLIVFEKS